MAVVQISRIQIRRGKANSGTGFPQLASGELGWAVDTQELYIGNGSVYEGAPAVGNTKVITQHDFSTAGGLLNLLQYTYKANDNYVTTGANTNYPVTRLIQDRLDDQVSVLDFVTPADIESNDYSTAIQRAVDQLFLNPHTASYSNTTDGIATRVSLLFPPGVFRFTETLFIPSYATLIGSGSEKTVLQYEGTSTAIQFVNDTSTIGNPSSITSTQGINQPRFISLSNMTISTNTSDQICIKLDAVKNSNFENLNFKGNWGNLYNAGSMAIQLNALSNIVTCENNKFKNISITGFSYGVFSQDDILNNLFDSFYIYDTYRGISFGEDSSPSIIGQQFGPRESVIINPKFKDILTHAVYIERGQNNTIENCQLKNVGNNGGGHVSIAYPQIFLGEHTNVVKNVQSDRTGTLNNLYYFVKTVALTLNHPITASKDAYVRQSGTLASGYLTQDVVNATSITLQVTSNLLFNTLNNLTIDGDSTPSTTNTSVKPSSVGSVQTSNYIPYIPEVAGYGRFESYTKLESVFGLAINSSNYQSAFRLPVSSDQFAVPQNSIIYTIEYQYTSISYPFIRKGVLNIAADVANANVRLTDTYDFIGSDPDGSIAIKLDFRVRFLDATGAVYTGALNQIPSAIDIEYRNLYSNDDNGVLTYSYSSSF